MIAELFLIVALSPRPMAFAHADTPAAIKAYHLMKSDDEKLTEWLRKENPGADVLIHPNPPEKKLKHEGWERVPLVHKDNKIWIRRKPVNDQPKQRRILGSA